MAYPNDDKPGAFIKGTALDALQSGYERIFSLTLLAVSFLGSVVTCSGGWKPILAGDLTLAGIVGGLLLQGICTLTQWIYRTRKWSPWYISALSIDATTTALGFYAILYWPIASIASLLVPQASVIWVVRTLVAVLSVLIAFLPENRLIREETDEQPTDPSHHGFHRRVSDAGVSGGHRPVHAVDPVSPVAPAPRSPARDPRRRARYR